MAAVLELTVLGLILSNIEEYFDKFNCLQSGESVKGIRFQKFELLLDGLSGKCMLWRTVKQT